MENKCKIFLLLLFLGVSMCALRPIWAAEKSEIVFGYSASITGPWAWMGEKAHLGYSIWAEMVNEKGGIYVKEYGKKLKVKLIMYDDKSDSTTAAKLYEKLIDSDKVDFILSPVGSPLAFPVSGIAQKYGVPFIISQASSDNIVQQGYDCAFLLLERGSRHMYPSISALKNPKLIPDPPKKLLIISPKDLYGITASKGGEEYAKKLGFDVRTEEVEKGAKDYTPIISWAKGSGVDGVITVLWPGDFFLFFRQIQEMKFRPKYLDGLHGSAATKVWETFGETAQGLCAGGYYGARFPTYENKEYNERYKKKCGEDPTHFSSMEVATGQIMHQAIEKAGTLDRKKVKEILKRDEFKCVYSNRVKFVSEGGCTNINKFSYFTLLQWQNGKALTLYPPEFAEAKPIYPMPFK